MLRSLPGLLCLTLLLSVSAGRAQNLAPEVLNEVKAVKLDQARVEQVLTALEQLTAYTLKQPDWQSKVMATMRARFDERIAMMEADPGSSAIFKANKLTVREYMVGLLALRASWMASSGNAPALGQLATEENTAFMKSHPTVAERLAKVDNAMSSAAGASRQK
jgi:hypothetical protein